jgi:uncharacterized damage-inducible protein DinB
MGRQTDSRSVIIMADYAGTILELVEYELWCNLRAVDFLEGLSPAAYDRDFGFGWRTPRQTIYHIANVMRTWSRCTGPIIDKPAPLPYDHVPSLQEIRALFLEIGDAWLAAVQQSHEQGLLDIDRRLHQVFHLVTHGSHHRGQLLSMLTLMGYEQPFEGGDFGGWSRHRKE